MRGKLFVPIGLVLCAAGVAVALHHRAPPPPQGPALRIGSVIPEPPSSNHELGRAVREGATLAARDLEREWGGALRIELVFADSGGSKSTARAKLDDLRKKGIGLFLDVVDEEALRECSGIVREHKLCVVSATSRDPTMSGALGSWMLRVPPQEDGGSAHELGAWARELGVAHPVTLHGDDEHGASQKRGLMQALAMNPRAFPVADGQLLAQGVIDKALETKPDAVFLLLKPRDAAAALKELRKRAPEAKVFGAEGLASPELAKLAGPDAAGVLFVEPEQSGPPPRRTAVEEAWRKEFGAAKDPSPYLFYAYDALQVLARAAKEANGDPSKTVDQLRVIDYDGTSGRVAFDSNGDRRPPSFRRRTYTSEGVSIPFTR
jgi:branched-chain amino acid transport system substrate-binding protein